MSPQTSTPSRGEVWLANFDPTKGREQAGTRPCLIFSVDPFNSGPLDLIIAVPITSTQRGWATHVGIKPPEGGLKNLSFIKCEDIRSMSRERLIKRLGLVSQKTMAETEERIRFILGLK
jgi:mRNA interferase MazF